VYEFGQDFLCMLLLEGRTLEEALNLAGEDRIAPNRLAEFLDIFVKVCDAVSFAHSRGVIHRDLKPANIMIGDFGQVYVLDWGIAVPLRPDGDRVTGGPPRGGEVERGQFDAPGILIGTPSYMAPEQLSDVRSAVHSTQTDVFGLGASLYQILTGQPPMTTQIIRSIWRGGPALPIASPSALDALGRVPPDLSRIALRATSYDPASRYPCVADLKREIESFQRRT
jgi:serine/threonine-protein kinase